MSGLYLEDDVEKLMKSHPNEKLEFYLNNLQMKGEEDKKDKEKPSFTKSKSKQRMLLPRSFYDSSKNRKSNNESIKPSKRNRR